MRRTSLRARLVATALLASTLTAVVLVVGVQVLLGRTNDTAVRERLDARTAAAEATVVERDGRVSVLEGARTLDSDLWVFDEAGRLVDGTLHAGPLADAVRRAASAPGTDRTLDGFRVVSRTATRGGQPLATVVAAQDLAPSEASERHSLWLSLVLGLATVALATGSAWLAATRSLRQVAAMAERADEWREHDRPQRFALGTGGDEITRLGRTLDRMLDRIHEALLAERRLTDEIAHELRTPLTVIRAEADLALHDARDGARDSLVAIVGAADQMRDAIDTMLAVARAHAEAQPRCTVGDLLASVGVRRDDGRELAAPLAPLTAALRPLLDNATVHGHGPATVTVEERDDRVVVVVSDDGPGVGAGDLERVFEPGHTTRADGGGAGLGLPLARRMARAVGAAVVALPGPGGRFELSVPRAT